MPDRKYFSNIAIPKLYEKTRESVATDVKSAVYFASTTDLWSSQTMEPYLSYTVHYIGDDWKLQSRSLQTLYLPDDHTGENIAQALTETLRTWELDSVKQVCVTSDNERKYCLCCSFTLLESPLLLWSQPALGCSIESVEHLGFVEN